MGQFADLDAVTLTVQRLFPRKSVVTVVVGPQGEQVGNFTVKYYPHMKRICFFMFYALMSYYLLLLYISISDR